jgi:hypothetical protein
MLLDRIDADHRVRRSLFNAAELTLWASFFADPTRTSPSFAQEPGIPSKR